MYRVALTLLVALLAALVWYLSSRLEPYETTIDSGYSAAARRDPLLALTRFLDDGRDIRRADSAARLGDLSAVGTVIATDANHLYSERQIERVLDWVADGGHLIAATGDTDSPLLAHFGVELAQREEQTREQQLEALRERLRQLDTKAAPEAAPTLALEFDGEAAPIDIALCDCRDLLFGGADDAGAEQPEPLYAAGFGDRTQFLQYEYGDGLITFAAELDFWHNDAIGRHDHAYLADRLIDGDVVLLSAARTAPLPALIWRAAPELVTALGLLLAAWLWHRAARFGPLRDSETAPRRALAEHLLASARYQWRQRQLAPLLRQVRDELAACGAELPPDTDPATPERLCATVTDLQHLDRTLR